MFLTPAEIVLAQRDYEDLINSPEATKVTLSFRVALTNHQGNDDVYGVTNEQLSTTRETAEDVPCLQHILKLRDIQNMPALSIEEGWCVFYFSADLDLEEPLPGKVPIAKSLTIIDPSGVEWEPHLHNNANVSLHLIFRLGDQAVGQPILCHPKK